MPELTPSLQGMAAFRARYANGPFAEGQVQAEVVQRIVMGSKVIDHELVHGRSDTPAQVAVVYHCRDGRISEAYFFSPDVY